MISSSQMWGLSSNKCHRVFFANLVIKKKNPKSNYLKSRKHYKIDCVTERGSPKANCWTPKNSPNFLSPEVRNFQLYLLPNLRTVTQTFNYLLLVRVKTFRMAGSLPGPELNILRPDQTAGQPTSHQIKHILFMMNSLEPKNLILLQKMQGVCCFLN